MTERDLLRSAPILNVRDLMRAVDYYYDVLAFGQEVSDVTGEEG